MTDISHTESFLDFKNSFSYGSRGDLSFKFLKSMSESDGAWFLQELLNLLGETLNDGDVGRLVDHVIAGQRLAYAGPSPSWQYADGPFAPLTKPVSAARLALITSSGHFMDGDDPMPFGVQDMTQAEATERINDFLKAKPDLSTIPWDAPAAQLRVRHPGYDIRGAMADYNVTLPLDPLRALAAEGRIGGLTPTAYSFVGAAAQLPLVKRTGPEWVARLQEDGAEAALLVPV